MENLKEILSQDDVVLFIGSGISLWSGLPTWSGLIEQLAQFMEKSGADATLVRSEARRGDLLQAASYGFDKLTKQQIGQFIRNACLYGTAQPHEIHRRICLLGPRCFVTTNYDNLIELSLLKWQPNVFYRPPITNRHLTEIAEIINARAKDYIFKPHGDAGDADSIVLTREQYRELLPQGNKYTALETLKTILSTRPVVYIGFGLRDPDFLYLKDILSNTYSGGPRDHYAIMADVAEGEADYWRRNYGLHLISYATIPGAAGTEKHLNILSLLDSLAKKEVTEKSKPVMDPLDPNIILALARYASGLSRTPKLPSEFKIRVQFRRIRRRGFSYLRETYDRQYVDKFLTTGPETALLIGHAGAGKTYSLKRASAELADKLHEECLANSFMSDNITVPFYVDFKLYRGEIKELISKLLPPALDFDEVAKFFKMKIFIDSFNEMPREFWENSTYEADLQGFIKENRTASIIIGSRTTDGLDKLNFNVYMLDQIDEDTVIEELAKKEISFEGRFKSEVYKLLSKPFYFQYILNGTVSLPMEAHPKDFYSAFFDNVREGLDNKFKVPVDIELILSQIAYNTLNKGEEVFPVADLTNRLKGVFFTKQIQHVQPSDIVNWLIASSVIIPYSGGRVSFIHQSITEYLAATQLAHQYKLDGDVVKEKLTLTRWDQALFLTLSFLPESQADKFLNAVIDTDLALAVNAVKYLETNRDSMVNKLLPEIIRRSESEEFNDWGIQYALENQLPINHTHNEQLRILLEREETWAATAAKCLISANGEKVKDELLQLIYVRKEDYNLCAAIGTHLAPFAIEGDLIKLEEWCDLLEDKYTDNNNFEGFISGMGSFLENIPISTLRSKFLKRNENGDLPQVRSQIVSSLLWHRPDDDALKMSADLLLEGVNSVISSICFIAKDNDDKISKNLNWECFSTAHVDILIAEIFGNDYYFAKDALSLICVTRTDISEYVRNKAMTLSGVNKMTLLYCINNQDLTPIYDFFQQLVEHGMDQISQQALNSFNGIDFDWTGRVDLFLSLIHLKNINVLKAILPGVVPCIIKALAEIEIVDIQWWLEWITELVADADQHLYWFGWQLGSILGFHSNGSTRDQLLNEFNKQDSKQRLVLEKYVLQYMENLSTDDLSEDAISYLLASLRNKTPHQRHRESLLSMIATESFIVERIIPLLEEAEPPLRENLKLIALSAGTRHGKRYVAN